MRWQGYNAYYYESVPIDTLNAFDVPEKDGVKTGGMPAKKFLKLVDDIRENGLTNPICVEHGRRMTVAIGNNRVWALKHLGYTHAPIILFAKEATRPAGGEQIPLKYLDSRLKKLHPGDDTWRLCGAARWIRRAGSSIVGLNDIDIVV